MPRNPRVLHIGNPANVAAELRSGLAATGKAECLVFETHNNHLQFAEDVRFSWDWVFSRPGRALRHASYGLLLKTLMDAADLIHVHTSGTWTVAAQRWARNRGKPVIRHFHGEEVRAGGVEVECRRADAILVATPDLLGRLPTEARGRARWIPNPWRFSPMPPEAKHAGTVRVVHAHLRNPSYAHVFGSETIRAAVNNLRLSGHDVTLDEVSGVTHQEALKRYAKADIAVDKLRIGWYGMFTVECVSMGVPVLAGIAPDLRSLDPPVLPVNESSLGEALESLVRDQSQRRQLAEQLFSRARAMHDTEIVASRVAATYESLLG